MRARSSLKANKRRSAHRFGLAAEQLCAWWLRCKGYRILGVRVKTYVGEIDIVAARGNTLAIVEVKARKSLVGILDTITPHKRARLQRAALALPGKIAGRMREGERTIRFDVMLVAPWTMPRHMPDAWRPYE